MSETLGLKNINLLTKEQYDGVAEPTNEELWGVEVETYHDDKGNWYRIYPDGWCEQGGIIAGSQTTVSLLKSYIDTNYSVLMSGANYGGESQSLGTSSRTASNFVVGTSSYQRFWQACGQGE